jgi:hypothetical protein
MDDQKLDRKRRCNAMREFPSDDHASCLLLVSFSESVMWEEA